MIIDSHTHIFPDPVARRALHKVISNLQGRLTAYTNGTLHGLLASMDAALQNTKKLSVKERFLKKLLRIPFQMLNRGGLGVRSPFAMGLKRRR